MNPREITGFFKSDMGKFALFALIVVIGGILVYGVTSTRHAAAEKIGKIAEKVFPKSVQPVHVERNTAEFVTPTSVPTQPGEKGKATVLSKAVIPTPSSVTLPISLYHSSSSDVEVSDTYAPYGRLIPCETVITIDSAKISTPIVGFVTEDVYHNGSLIIPAGAEIHGKAQTDRSRERISSDNHWIVVWRTTDSLNGAELPLEGIALDMERDYATGTWALTDGSAGLKGDLIKTDNLAELKLFAATFLSAATTGFQDTQSSTSPLTGETHRTPLSTPKNAVLQGASAVVSEYAQQILEAIKRDGFYVRVPAGKQFYIYVTQTIDRQNARKGGSMVRDLEQVKEPRR